MFVQIVNNICALLDKKNISNDSYKKLIRFVDDRPGHDKRYAINSKYINRELGWEPKHTFEEAINKTISWYLNNKEWCDNIKKKGQYKGERIGISKSINNH